ncbi:hypothetical protein HJFPF1_10158 [Paramyrothecium foliicola]|nr:hypothetical protein HJFPF1_10158 [Paramyrothecium foliicola]
MLDNLPQEILLSILGYRGSSFFREDVTRLTVSKRWYRAAWLVFARDIELTNGSLIHLLDDQAIISRVQPVLKSAVLHLEMPATNDHDTAIPYDDDDDEHLVERAIRLRSALEVLANALHQCPQLQNLEITARLHLSDITQPGYSDAKLLANLVSIPLLTSFYLDTASLRPTIIRKDPDIHACCELNSLLPSLRNLRCRMDNVCEALLKPPSGVQSLQLEEVIINLSISGLSGTVTAYRYSRDCVSDTPNNFLQLQQVIEAQAVALSQISQARTIRILYHQLPSLDVFAFDAVLGKRVKFELGAAWDSMGELVDESEPDNETDLFHSDSEDSESTTA